MESDLSVGEIREKGETSLVADRVSKTFRSFFWRRKIPALVDFSLRLEPGQVVGVVGRNGSGKSTALRCLTGLIRPTEGSVRLFGKDPRDPMVRRRIGYLPEVSDLNPLLTPKEVLHFHGRLLGWSTDERRKRVAELLDRLDLLRTARRPLQNLSHGTVRRTSIGVALFSRPDLVVLDEPLSGIDPEGVLRFRELVGELRDRGSSIVLSSHILSVLPEMTERILLIHEGRIRAEGEVSQLLRESDGTSFVVRGLSATGRSELESFIERHGGRVVATKPAQRSLEDFYLDAVKVGGKESAR